MTAPNILVIDIERQSAIVEGIWDLKQNGYISPGNIIVPSRMICFAWKWLGETDIHFSAEWDPKDEGEQQDPLEYKHTGLYEEYQGHYLMTKIARDVLDKADYVIGWNSKAFDMKHINTHIAEHDIPVPSPYQDIDLVQTSRKRFGFMSHKLDEAATHFGLWGKASTGGNLWKTLRWGDGQALEFARDNMRTYNLRDVQLTEEIFLKMRPWVAGLNMFGDPDASDVEVGGDERCRRCDSLDLDWSAAGPRRFSTYWYRRFRCRSCGGWGHGTKSYYHMETGSS